MKIRCPMIYNRGLSYWKKYHLKHYLQPRWRLFMHKETEIIHSNSHFWLKKALCIGLGHRRAADPKWHSYQEGKKTAMVGSWPRIWTRPVRLILIYWNWFTKWLSPCQHWKLLYYFLSHLEIYFLNFKLKKYIEVQLKKNL